MLPDRTVTLILSPNRMGPDGNEEPIGSGDRPSVELHDHLTRSQLCLVGRTTLGDRRTAVLAALAVLTPAPVQVVSIRAPMTGWVALPLAISRPALLASWSLGMAEPTPILPDCPSVLTELATRAIAEFTPTTRPVMSSNGSAAVARVVCRVALDRVDERGARGAGPAGGYRAVQGADNATGHSGVQTQGSTHPDDRLTHAHILGGAQHQHRQVCGARPGSRPGRRTRRGR